MSRRSIAAVVAIAASLGLGLGPSACGTKEDTGGDTDTSTSDTGPSDTGTSDTGPSDTGTSDTGPSDTGTSDTGTSDTGPSDTGRPLAAGECRQDADCSGPEERCFTEDDDWCGTCQDAVIECETKGDCDPGEVCSPEAVVCPCDLDTSWICEPACTEDSCAEGERCDLDSGLCETVHCTDGATCDVPHFSCVADAPGSGCVRDACTVDSDCGDGWCVRDQCFDTPGFCSKAPA